MNLPCELVQDLLPLYHDGVCSPVSRENIKEHLEGCGKCRGMLSALDMEIEAEKEVEAAKPLTSIRKKWKKDLKKSVLGGICIAAAVFVLLIGAFFGLTQRPFRAFSADEITVNGVWQDDDGWVHYKVSMEDQDAFGWYTCTLTEDGVFYLTPQRPAIILDKTVSYASISFDPESAPNMGGVNGMGIALNAYYVGTPEDAVLIWERGMELPDYVEPQNLGPQYAVGN